MELDLVGYRYTETEMRTMMALQGAGTIPCLPRLTFPNKAEFQDGLASLREADILSGDNSMVLLDRVHALLITTLCACGTYVRIQDAQAAAALCAGEKLSLAVQIQDQKCLVWASPRFGDLRETLLNLLRLFPGAAEICLCQEGRNAFCETLDKQALDIRANEAFEQLLARFRPEQMK